MPDFDIFTKEPITIVKPEHIFPSAFGGELVSKAIIDGSTNDLFGRTCERQLIEAHAFFLNALEIQSRRGKTQGRTIYPKCSDGPYRIAPGLRPELRKTGFWKEPRQNGTVEILQARTEEQALELLSGLEKRDGIKLDPDSTVIKHRLEYPKEPIRIGLVLGGPPQLAAIAKICLELLAYLRGNNHVLLSDYDEIRYWTLAVARHLDAGAKERPLPYQNACNHDYRPSLWENMPLLANAPFQHRIQIHGGSSCKGVWAALELFGHFSYSCVLSCNAEIPPFDCIYLVDQVGGATMLREGIRNAVTVPEIAEHAVDLEQGKVAIEKAVHKVQDKLSNDAIARLVDDAIRGSLPAIGEQILPEHIERFSHNTAERFVFMMNRMDEEKEITLRDLLEKRQKADK